MNDPTFLMNAEKLRIAAALIAEVDLELVERTARLEAIAADVENWPTTNPATLVEVACLARPIHHLMHTAYRRGSGDEPTNQAADD